MELAKFKAAAKLAANRKLLVVRKHSPAILMTAGIAGMVGTVVLASRATLRLEAPITELEDRIEKIGRAQELEESDYTEEDAQRDRVLSYSKAGIQIVKLYLPAVTLGVASIGAIVGGQHILNKRNVALAAAYTAMQNGFNEYRKRVQNELGEDKERELRYPMVEEKRTVKDPETGEEREESIFLHDPNGLSIYARIFDELCPEWSKDPEYNRMFLQTAQNHFNELLRAQGHLFLNEVYDHLGFPRSPAGQVVGWLLSEEGDNFVDFGMFNTNREAAREFINGYEKAIILDFNVDGVIWDKI